MGPMVSIVVLLFAKLVIEKVDVVGNAVLVEQPVKLLIIDTVCALHLAIPAGVLGRM
jgi:cation transport ATPase